MRAAIVRSRQSDPEASLTDRRNVIKGLAAAVVGLSSAAVAQQRALPLVGILTPHRDHPQWPAFFDELQKLGLVDGQTIKLVMVSADHQLGRLEALAGDLAAARPDVVIAVNTPGSLAAAKMIEGPPIVICDVGDPVGIGVAESLARPGRNRTGVSNQGAELTSKRLSVLKSLVPSAKRFAILYHPDDPNTLPQRREADLVAPSLGIKIGTFEARRVAELDATFARIDAWHAEAALWLSGQAAAMQAHTIELARARRLPAMVLSKEAVYAGGLVSYYPDQAEIYRRVAGLVAKILRGTPAGELPIEQPSRFELVINLKAAKALGLDVPNALLLQADEIVQ